MTTSTDPRPLVGADNPTQATPNEAFQNHEDRLQSLERLEYVLGEALPHVRDALGLERRPHQFTPEEATGIAFNPNQATISSLVEENKKLERMLTTILQRLPGLPAGGDVGGSGGADGGEGGGELVAQ